MKKSILSVVAVVVLSASSLTASAQPTVKSQAMGGCNPLPQAMGGSNPRPRATSQAMGGCNPLPQGIVGTMYSAVRAIFGI